MLDRAHAETKATGVDIVEIAVASARNAASTDQNPATSGAVATAAAPADRRTIAIDHRSIAADRLRRADSKIEPPDSIATAPIVHHASSVTTTAAAIASIDRTDSRAPTGVIDLARRGRVARTATASKT
jgi:hypothetical protein